MRAIDRFFGGIVPGTALPAGSSPSAAVGALPTKGPLANMLVTGQSQKATGDGAVTTDANLAAGAVLYQLKLEPVFGAEIGVVFDGTATGFSFGAYAKEAFQDAVMRALTLYRTRPDQWREVMRNGMLRDWSWERSAAEYERLYQRIVDGK